MSTEQKMMATMYAALDKAMPAMTSDERGLLNAERNATVKVLQDRIEELEEALSKIAAYATRGPVAAAQLIAIAQAAVCDPSDLDDDEPKGDYVDGQFDAADDPRVGQADAINRQGAIR